MRRYKRQRLDAQWRSDRLRGSTHVLNTVVTIFIPRVGVHLEDGRGHDNEALIEARVEQLLHQFLAVCPRATRPSLFPPVPRVLVDMDPRPYEHTRLGRYRLREACACHLFRENVQEEVAAALVLGPEALYPLVKARKLPPVGAEELAEEDLPERVRVLTGRVGERDELLVELRAGGDPAEPHAWRNDLAEGVDAHDASVYVQRDERRCVGCAT